MPGRGAAVALLVLVLAVPACGGGGDQSFCDAAVRFEESDLASGEGPIEDRFTEALEALDELVERAPDEIVGDMAAVRDGLEDFVRGGSGLGPRFRQASRRVSEYLAAECGIQTPEPLP